MLLLVLLALPPGEQDDEEELDGDNDPPIFLIDASLRHLEPQSATQRQPSTENVGISCLLVLKETLEA